MLRILEVIPSRKKSIESQEDVIIRAYDEDYKIHEFPGKKTHITPSREVIPDKHNYTPQTLLEELRKEFPGMKFEAKPYGKKTSVEELPEDIRIYVPTDSFVIQHIGPRHERKQLEFYLDEEKTKPLFITKIEKQHMARTTAIRKDDPQLEERLKNNYDYFTKELSGIVPGEDITLNEKRRFIQLNITKEQLTKLSKTGHGKYFRIQKLKSEEFSDEEQARELYEKLKKIPGIKENTDQLRIGERITKERKKEFFVQALANEKYKGTLKEYGLKQKEGPDRIDTIKNNPDPLGLNNLKQQLRNFFPAHLAFNPDKSLEEQANTEIHPYKEGIENIVSTAEQCYLNNTCAVDIEKIHYRKNDPNQEQINAAVLKSLSEHKLYVTKKYLEEKFNIEDMEKKKWKGADLVIVEDEIELRAMLSRDASEYEYIAGHNVKGFDHEVLKMYNDENELLENGEINEATHERIKQVKKKYNLKNLWEAKQNSLLDTLNFIRPRSGLLLDHKLDTFGGFGKMGHEDLERKATSGKIEDLYDVLDYTADDGHNSWKVFKDLLPYAIIESIATSKPLKSVFSSNPVKNFYESVNRSYFMKMNTYAFRHDRSFKVLSDRLKDRLSPEELLGLQVNGKRQVIGEYKANLYYPSVMLDSFREIIDANPVTSFLSKKVESEKNPLAKDIGLSQLSASIHVAADKVKNFMENAGLVFGKKYELHEVYSSMNEDTLNRVKEKFYEEKEEELSDFEMSRTSYIFSREYNVQRKALRHAGISFDSTILHFNNLFAENFKGFERKGFLGRSGKYYVSNTDSGYGFGDVRVLNMPGKKMLASLNAHDGYTYEVFANFRPGQGSGKSLLKVMAEDWVKGAWKGIDCYRKDNRFLEESKGESFKGFIKAVNRKL